VNKARALVTGGSGFIAGELAPKLKPKGFRGKLITPLPVPRFL
jgi:nucleoside-diphosphate-sugar epimerase